MSLYSLKNTVLCKAFDILSHLNNLHKSLKVF